MPLFSREQQQDDGAAAPGTSIPGLPGHAARQGWQPRSGQPFDGHLEAAVAEVARVLYHGQPPITYFRPGRAGFRDAYGGMFGGRRFAVANAWTKVGDELRPMSVCALELPAPLPIFQVRPSQFPPFGFGRPVSAGDPLFDTGFTVLAREAAAAQAVLTPEARRLIMARADWIFLAERLEFACLTMQPFESVEQVSTRIAEVHALLAAIPAAASPA